MVPNNDVLEKCANEFAASPLDRKTIEALQAKLGRDRQAWWGMTRFLPAGPLWDFCAYVAGQDISRRSPHRELVQFLAKETGLSAA